MKRYWLFCFDKYEAGGGMNDFMDDFDTIDAAVLGYESDYKDCFSLFHVFDSVDRVCVVGEVVNDKLNIRK